MLPPLADPTAQLSEQVAQLARLETERGGVDAALLPVLQRGRFTVLDLHDQPVCCGFFVTDTGVALTVHHDLERFLRPDGKIHAVMLKDAAGAGLSSADGGSRALAPGEAMMMFQVHSSSRELGYACMNLASPLPKSAFQPLRLPPEGVPAYSLIGTQATLLKAASPTIGHFAWSLPQVWSPGKSSPHTRRASCTARPQRLATRRQVEV